MPIPPVPDHCVSVDAGPIRFLIEARELTDESAAAVWSQRPGEQPEIDDDFGASLHVLGTADDLEHLRFDCFERDPHYHYITQADQRNLVCRFDEIAQGEPIAWTLSRLRERLPEMLEFAGASQLAAAARDSWPEIIRGIDRVTALMEEVDRRATHLFKDSIAARGGLKSVGDQ